MGTVLVATALVSGIAAVLAALLLVAERYIVTFGECAIDINEGEKRIETQGGGVGRGIG